jgi:hypothetical protein
MARRGSVTLVLAGAWACPTAAGQLALLGKPFGGVLGVPGAVVGYIALTALVAGGVTGVFARRGLPPRVAGGCAVAAGAGFVVAGVVTASWLFTVAVLLAGAAAGPLFVTARAVALAEPASLRIWHVSAAAGIAGAAGLAAVSELRPGVGLVVAGVAAAALGVAVETMKTDVGQHVPFGKMQRRLLLGYVAVGLAVGGTVLPALHLLLFRWNVLDGARANLLLLAALPALLVLAVPGPHPSAVAPLLILSAGGPVLVATAPGRATLAIGIAVTLAAAARAARGLDLAVRTDGGPPTRFAALSALLMIGAGLLGLALVTAVGELFGTGTGLTVLAMPALIAALLYGHTVRTPLSDPAPVLQGGPS